MAASHPAVRLSRLARIAAEKNYKSTREKYSRGQVNVVTLIDAQTNFLNQQKAEASATYTYLKDAISLQRAIAWFEYSKSKSQISDFLQHYRDFQKPVPSMFASLKNNLPGLLIPFLFVGCHSEEKTPPPKPRPVITYTVPKSSNGSTRRFSGETKAAKSVELGFELAGRIDTLLAEEGKRYEKGTVLAQLDPASANADLSNAEAQALQAVQQLRRTQELLESGNASQADFDSAIANQKAAEAKLASAKLAVQYTTLTMPYDGTVAAIPADVNQVVSAGTPVISIQGNIGMDFETGVPTNIIARIKEDQKVTLTLGDLSDQKITGTVTKVSPIATNNTTYPVTISIDNPEQIKNLRAGLDGEAMIKFPNLESKGLSIPGTAISAQADGSNYVWLVDTPEQATSSVTRTKVTLGILSGDGRIDVLTGLQPGQVVVSKGVESLTPGMEVTLPND